MANYHDFSLHTAPNSHGELGYYLDPPTHANDPLHTKFTVWLRSEPTQRHYDPERVHCAVVSLQKDEWEKLTVDHPWPRSQTYRTLPGRIIVEDRTGKEIEVFTFGAQLQVLAEAQVTTCIFQSPVPLLGCLLPGNLACQVASEVEVILAETRARWEITHLHGDFEKQLLRLEPEIFYPACLAAVQRQLQTLALADETTHTVLHFINHERRRLLAEGVWPEGSDNRLDKLLGIQ